MLAPTRSRASPLLIADFRCSPDAQGSNTRLAGRLSGHEFHLGRTDEAGDEQVLPARSYNSSGEPYVDRPALSTTILSAMVMASTWSS